MNKNKFQLTLAAAVAGLVFSIAACVGPTPAAQAGDAAARQAGERSVSPAGIATAWIPAGTFTMGSPYDETGRFEREGPRRQVTISEGFWMGVYPVTQEQWVRVMGGNPVPGDSALYGSRRPVVFANWYDAIVFANRLSILEGLSPAYRIAGSVNPDDWGAVPTSGNDERWDAVEIVPGANGWRLPTEAQWEYAARAGTSTAFSNGTQHWNDQSSLDRIGWFGFNSEGRTHDVGLKTANRWGLHDMHGNVMEWVWDWWGMYPPQAQSDPAGPPSAVNRNRVVRGGNWFWTAQDARSAGRNVGNPFARLDSLGLRLVRP